MSDSVSFRFPTRAKYAAWARQRAMAFLRSLRMCSDRELQEVQAALGEAVANAIQHGSGGSAFELRCWAEHNVISIEVEDFGSGFDAVADRLRKRPQSVAERGRGIVLIRAFADEVTYAEGGRLLRFKKRTSRPRLVREHPRCLKSIRAS